MSSTTAGISPVRIAPLAQDGAIGLARTPNRLFMRPGTMALLAIAGLATAFAAGYFVVSWLRAIAAIAQLLDGALH